MQKMSACNCGCLGYLVAFCYNTIRGDTSGPSPSVAHKRKNLSLSSSLSSPSNSLEISPKGGESLEEAKEEWSELLGERS